MWDFLKWVLTGTVEQYTAKLDLILANQHTILQKQAQLKELLMGAIERLNEFAVKVNDLTNAEAANLTAIIAAIEALKGKLVAAASEADVNAALDPVLGQIQAVADNLAATAANNQPVVPPPTPPVEPL